MKTNKIRKLSQMIAIVEKNSIFSFCEKISRALSQEASCVRIDIFGKKERKCKQHLSLACQSTYSPVAVSEKSKHAM